MAKNNHQIHDKAIKRLFENKSLTRDFIRAYVPEEIQSVIDLRTLNPLKSDLIEADLSAWYTDILISCKLAKTHQPGLIFFLIEHQTQNDRLMSLRMIHYTASILMKHARKEGIKEGLPVVFPIVFYTGKSKMNTDVYDLFVDTELAKAFTFQPAKVISTNAYTRDQLLALSPNIFFLTELFMINRSGQGGIIQILKDNPEPAYFDLLHGVDDMVLKDGIQYMIKVTSYKPKEVIDMLQTRLPGKEAVIKSTYDQILEEGEAIGEARGEANMLIKIAKELKLSLDATAVRLNASQEALKMAKSRLKSK